MVTLGIDAHKRTHTVVAVDARGRQLAVEDDRHRHRGSPARCCAWAEQFGDGSGCSGRSRTAGTCRGAWNAICSPPARRSCGCRRS